MKDIVISVIGGAKLEVEECEGRKDLFFIAVDDMVMLGEGELSLAILEQRKHLRAIVADVAKTICQEGKEHFFILTKASLAKALTQRLSSTLRGKGVLIKRLSHDELYRKGQLGVMSVDILNGHILKWAKEDLEEQQRELAERRAETQRLNTELVSRTLVVYSNVALPLSPYPPGPSA